MYKTFTYDEPKRKTRNYLEVENSEVYNENYEHPIYEDIYSKAKKRREKEKQLEEENKSLPKYKHKFAISPKIPGVDKAKFLNISFSGTIHSEYEIREPDGSKENRDSSKEPEHNIADFVFERDYITNQVALAANSENATLIDFGSGLTIEVGATYFKVDSNGKFSNPKLNLQAKGRLSASSEDGPVKQMITQIYGHDLFKKGSIVDIVAKIDIDTVQASKELLEFANKNKRVAKALNEEAKMLKQKATELKKTREKALHEFVKDEIKGYHKRNKKMPSEGKVKRYIEKFYRTETNRKFQEQIREFRKRVGAIEDELKQIQKILKNRFSKIVGILDGPLIRAALRVVGRILDVFGIFFSVIDAIITSFSLANDISRYGVQFGFNPWAILGLDEKGPGYDNPPLFVTGDSEGVNSNEPVHNDAFNFIRESGDGEKEGSGSGTAEGGSSEGKSLVGTQKETDKGNTEVPTVKAVKTGTGEKVDETKEKEKVSGSSGNMKSEKPEKKIDEQENNQDLKTRYVKVVGYERNKELAGNARSVPINVYGVIDDSLVGKTDIYLDLTLTAQVTSGVLYVMEFENVKVDVKVSKYDGVDWISVDIKQSMVMQGDCLEVELKAGKTYKIHKKDEEK